MDNDDWKIQKMEQSTLERLEFLCPCAMLWAEYVLEAMLVFMGNIELRPEGHQSCLQGGRLSNVYH